MYDELAPMNVAQMMDRAVWAYKKSFWKQLAFAAVVGVVFFVAVIIATMFFAVVMMLGLPGGDSPAGVLLVLLAVYLPLILLWLGISSAGHIHFTRQALIGHLVHLPKLKIHVLALRALSAIIAQVLIIFPIAAFLVYIFGSSLVLLENLTLLGDFNIAGFLLVLIMSLFVVISFLLVENIFALSVTVAMFEGKLFFKSISRSWELVRDEFFKIFATRFLWYMAGFGFMMAAQGLLFLLWALVGIMIGTLHPAFAILLIPVGIFSAIFPFFITFAQIPMDGIMRAVIYFNQRIKKEGLDIELKLHMIWQRRAVQ